MRSSTSSSSLLPHSQPLPGGNQSPLFLIYPFSIISAQIARVYFALHMCIFFHKGLYNILLHFSFFSTRWYILEITPRRDPHSSASCFSTYNSTTWMYQSLYKHSPMNGHLSCFQYFVITNNTPINILVPIYFPFWRYILKVDS